MDDKAFSPREFLRARRPEKFSDSVPTDTCVLNRSILEYHLSTLTSRSQETDFEIFARRLVQREVCPNLLPQTGPTGGGDGKVDSETYPVADQLSLVWHVGTGREAAGERWAFAFSAKKDWAPKLRSDIAKVADTQRGYRKAFFVTNQFVPSKKRTEEEDKLSRRYGLEVSILDRSWILDRVFVGKHEEIAIEDLGIQMSVHTNVRKGPLDFRKEQTLADVEARIQASTNDGSFGIQLVADCIEAATLARGLERLRTEIEGHFARAERVAARYGTSHQCLLCAYEKAWTTFWWYEDYHTFSVLYDDVENQVKGSQSAYDLELLSNLWNLLYPSVGRGDLDPIEAKLERRTTVLTSELDRLTAETERPSNALQARTLRLMIELMMNLIEAGPDGAVAVFDELQDVIRKCEGLVGFPFEPLLEMVTDIGRLFDDSPAYEKLFEAIVEIASKRKRDVSAARLLIKRGAQQLGNDKPYEAIRSLGRALTNLYKDESRHDLIRALYICSGAYERVGLLWAARGTLLTAASLATSDFRKHSDVTLQQAACYKRMKWLELQLGRITQTLEWHDIDRLVTAAIKQTPDQPEWLDSDEMDFDGILGMLLLRSDFTQLQHLSRLPDVLTRLGLSLSSAALLFALGHENKASEDLPPEVSGNLQTFFTKWCNQPAGKDLPPNPVLAEGVKIQFVSHVLGCEFVLGCPKVSPFIELGESILAALESLMATGMVDKLVAREPLISLEIQGGRDVEGYFEFNVKDDDGRPHFQIMCGDFSPNALSMEAQCSIRDKLASLMANLMSRAFWPGEEPNELLLRLFRDDLALERSLGFTGSFVVTGNVLGHSPSRDIIALCADANDYGVKRSEAWKASLKKETVPPKTLELVKGPTPPELHDSGRLRHTEVTTISLIREVLWNKAGFSGTAFILHLDFSVPPILALLFRNKEAADKIFENWTDELGKHDECESLRISIVRGIGVRNPYSYRIVIGVNPSTYLSGSDKKLAYMVSKIQTMEPSTDLNLRNFLDRYKRIGMYGIGCAFTRESSPHPDIAWDKIITKKELYVRDAWEIGTNDIDVVAIQPGDAPIIPEGKSDVPVIDVLRKKTR